MTDNAILADCKSGDWLRVPRDFSIQAAEICGFVDFTIENDDGRPTYPITDDYCADHAAAGCRKLREEAVMEAYLKDWPRMPHDKTARAGSGMPLMTLIALRGD